MSYSGSGNDGGWRNDGGVRPHAFDPDTQPELFRSVLTRRVFAFLIDLVVLSVPVILGYIFIAVFGLITLGLGWMLYPALFVIVAMLYFGLTIGGPNQASVGMNVMDLAVMRVDGRPMDFLTSIVYLVLFWLGNAVLTPFILLIGLFTDRSRLLHDLLLGTVVVRRSSL